MKRLSKGPFWQELKRGIHRRTLGASGATFEAIVLRGAPGPVAVINGGTHGDEYEGPTVLHELAASLPPSRLRGALVLIPVLHEAAFFAGMRCHPRDGSNLARVFPGSPGGNHASRIAHAFLHRVLKGANFYIDLHSGGNAYDLLPWVGYMITGKPEIDAVHARMAACFDDWWCWGSPYLPGRTLTSAADVAVPAIYTEARGGGSVHPDDRQALERGLRNFLVHFGFIAGPAPRLRRQRIRLAADADEAHLQLHHPSPIAGLFIPTVGPGDIVRRKAALGRVISLDGKRDVTVRAEHGGTVVSCRRQRSVGVGDALATIVALPAAR